MRKYAHWSRLVESPLIAAITGALTGALAGWWVSVVTTDLQHTPVFVSESFTFVEEFAEFYYQQYSDLAWIEFSPAASGLPLDKEQKRLLDEGIIKLSNAEQQSELLELKATRYFHDTDWLPLFENIHKIWSSAKETVDAWSKKLEVEPYGYNTKDLVRPLAGQLIQLLQATHKLQQLFIDKLKQLPAENSFFKTLPQPTPDSPD
jgi:hypothetical protein